jgi:hypothetical protein
MTNATIQFQCTSCGKKYSTPGSLAGKSLSCTCGAKVTVPSGQPPAQQTAGTGGGFQQYQTGGSPSISSSGQAPWQPPTVAPNSQGVPFGGSSGLVSNNGSRREFPALRTVATITEVISWLYVAGGVLGAMFMLFSRPPGEFGNMLFPAVGVLLVALLAAVFIRAMAEFIRLALYIVQLLEDVRANSG